MSNAIAPIPVGVDAFLIFLATSALVLRFIARKLSNASLGWDDWLALAAWPFSVGISISFLVAGLHGFGNHGGDPTFFLHALYFDEIWYNTGIALTKLSVLCFYRRIFAITKPLKWMLWTVGAFVLAWWISFTVASILQCVPIPGYWDPSIKAVCVYKYGFFLGQAIPNIALDFVLLALPIRPLLRLHLKKHQKIALVMVFILGYLNPVFSIIRITSFIQLGNHTGEDINWGFVAPALWSAAEVAIAIFSCCIPSMAYFLRQNIGLAKSTSAKQRGSSSKKLTPPPKRLADYSKDHQRTDSLERLQAHNSSPDIHDSAQPFSKVFLTGDVVGQNTQAAAPSYPLHSISVTKDFDVEYGPPALRQDGALEIIGRDDFGLGRP